MGVGKACPIAGLFGESGWHPFEKSIKFSIVHFRNRLMRMQDNRLTFNLYEWSKSLAEEGMNNCVPRIAELLSSLGDYSGLLNIYELGKLWLRRRHRSGKVK